MTLPGRKGGTRRRGGMTSGRDKCVDAVVLYPDNLPPAFSIFPSFVFINTLPEERQDSSPAPPLERRRTAKAAEGREAQRFPPWRIGRHAPRRHQFQHQGEGLYWDFQ